MASMLSLESEIDQDRSLTTVQSVPVPVVLQLTGGKPLRISGELVAECSSWTASASSWHDLQIFVRDTGEFVVALRSCRGDAGESDVFHARAFASRDEAMLWLQEFDPTADMVADLDPSDRRISAPEIALRAAALRQRMDRLQMQYRSMIGELLYRLDIGG